MNHIIGKSPEKAEASADTAVLKTADEPEETGKETSDTEGSLNAKIKSEAAETAAEIVPETKTTEEISEKERRRGTALRIGAFLTAAICLLAGVRAIRNPEKPQETVFRGVSALTAKATEEADSGSDKARTQNASPTEQDIHTTVFTQQNTPRESEPATSSVQSSETTAAGGLQTGSIEPLSKTRTQEELAEAFAAIPLSNEAQLAYDAETLSTLVPAFQITAQSEPLVLIVHTHGSEAYADTDGHSQNTKQNVVAVGDALEETLTELGIPVLHDQRMYDVPSYTRSYNEAYKGIREMLERNPSIQIVMDIHRDAYTYDDGSMLRTTDTLTDAEGKPLRTARVMFLVGTNAGTLEHPTWRSHLAFAMALQTRMEDIVPGITRSVFLRRQRFNEHLTPGSLLVEVGSSGDTLEEAKAAVRVFGRALAEQILAKEA